MKKIILKPTNYKPFFLILIAILFGKSTNAQQWNGASNNLGLITRLGSLTAIDATLCRVTLGTSYAGAPLWGTGYIGFNLRKDGPNNWTYLTDGGNNGGAVIFADVTGGLSFSIKNGWLMGSTGFLTDNQISNNVKMHLSRDGGLLLGDVTVPMPAGYRLYVQDGILTEKLKVALSNTNDWSDFVFDKNYKLKPLKEVEKYIIENKHLPDLPSASEMVQSGIDVAKTEALLLQKIEELTLYVIELKKQNEALKESINNLKQ